MNTAADSTNLTKYLFAEPQQGNDTAAWNIMSHEPESISTEIVPVSEAADLSGEATVLEGEVGEPIPYRLANDNVVVGMWLIGLIVLTATFLRIRSLIRAGWWQTLKASDSDVPSLTLHWWDYLIAFLSLSIMFTFAVFAVSKMGGDISGGDSEVWFAAAVTAGLVFIFLFLRLAIQSWINSVFWSENVVGQWRATFLLATAAAAALLFFLGMATVYVPDTRPYIPFILIFIYGTFKIFLLFSEISIFSAAKTAFSHIILYICTLEILPLFFLWKFVEFLSTNTTITDIS